METGMDLFACHKKSINTEKYIDYLNDLRKLHKGKNIAIFCDNLSVHHNWYVKDKLEDLEIPCIYNAAYAPQFNPIELVFSKVKQRYKVYKTNEIVNKKRTHTETLIQRAFSEVEQRHV